MSDLHLETPKAYDVYQIPPAARYLALLGDIGNVNHLDDFATFLAKQLDNFPGGVLLVPGNHEAYNSDWPHTTDALIDAAAALNKGISSRLIVLDRVEFRPPDSPGVVILGCSLFSHVPPERRQDVSLRLNDFMVTEDWAVEDHNMAHERDLSWLNSRVAELEGQDDVTKIIILTHWSPSIDPRAGDPRHAGSPISSAFSTDLSGEPCFKSPKVKLWAFGHTHFNCDFTVQREGGAEPLRLLANQRGYYFQQAAGFDILKTVEL